MLELDTDNSDTEHLQGQQAGGTGEETALAWEDFPFTGIIKTYNTDKQIPDSAGTATALFRNIVLLHITLLSKTEYLHMNTCLCRMSMRW